MYTFTDERPGLFTARPVFLGIRQVLHGDPDFPSNLTGEPGFPQLLFYRGQLLESSIPKVAIVGSRNCSEVRQRTALELSSELARAGVAVVSGLAKGIDGAAHRGALKVGGQTIAVLGTGLNRICPLEHRDLAEHIAQTGTLFSQFSPDFTGYKGGRNYLLRNHLISGLSQMLVVIEAQERSGSIAALRAALTQGRPVGLSRFLVESQSWASALVESGTAFLVDSPEDVLRRVQF